MSMALTRLVLQLARNRAAAALARRGGEGHPRAGDSRHGREAGGKRQGEQGGASLGVDGRTAKQKTHLFNIYLVATPRLACSLVIAATSTRRKASRKSTSTRQAAAIDRSAEEGRPRLLVCGFFCGRMRSLAFSALALVLAAAYYRFVHDKAAMAPQRDFYLFGTPIAHS